MKKSKAISQEDLIKDLVKIGKEKNKDFAKLYAKRDKILKKIEEAEEGVQFLRIDKAKMDAEIEAMEMEMESNGK